MLELLQLTETVLIATAITLSIVTAPAVILRGEEPVDIKPLLESVEEITQ